MELTKEIENILYNQLDGDEGGNIIGIDNCSRTLNKLFNENQINLSILEKYIKYVKDCEGTDFIHIHDKRYASDVVFTDKEWSILEEISKRVNYKNSSL